MVHQSLGIWAISPEGKKKLEALNDQMETMMLALLVFLILGTIGYFIFRYWKKTALEVPDFEKTNETTYRSMLISGQITQAEYDKLIKNIQSRVEEKKLIEES
ncbi:hypothetical protein KIH39_00920 [Telmatocola sphagniphila]|uniref:Uncharacterized protein n=1 Tax=Telmatocola sphagniphila TaxID=1123043 RepID=A0A8E6B7D8_9BACT|nr:hypothetical protein [Telmatocola sphagniphila]QVL32511.1 hypothetical protein KIH39_00920 [Telmatocola sphagniphila]